MLVPRHDTSYVKTFRFVQLEQLWNKQSKHPSNKNSCEDAKEGHTTDHVESHGKQNHEMPFLWLARKLIGDKSLFIAPPGAPCPPPLEVQQVDRLPLPRNTQRTWQQAI